MGCRRTERLGCSSKTVRGLWFPSDRNQGILRFENGKFVLRVPPDAADKEGFNGLLSTGDGKLWGTQGNVLTRLRPGEAARFVLTSNGPEALVNASELDSEDALQVKFPHSSRDGGIWVASSGGIRKLRVGRWEKSLPSPAPINAVAAFYEDRDNVCRHRDDGLRQFHGRRNSPTQATDSPVHEPVRSISKTAKATSGSNRWRRSVSCEAAFFDLWH